MAATYDGEAVHAGAHARERFHDSRGYGRPVDGDLVLAPVEAAHLLFRGDLDAVVDDSPATAGRELGFRTFLRTAAVSEVDFLVYKDLRERGFYLSPTDDGDFVVYPRGSGPWDDTVAYRVRPTSERGDVPAATLESLAGRDATGVLAVVDEESELTYLEVDRRAIAGSTFHDLPAGVAGEVLSERVLVADPPPAVHERAFYGQRLADDASLLQLSLVEAAYLAGTGVLDVEGDQAAVAERDQAAIAERGREVEGERFDRRLRAYSALRTAGIVPKTGFKFGADFRTYAHVESVDDLGHSELLVGVHPPDHAFAPRDLALDVRLAGGVRKRLVYALTGPERGIAWLSVARLTP